MNPLSALVALARDYLFVLNRRWDSLVNREDPDEFVSAGPLRPVLLIPGIYEDWLFMHPIAERLAAAGHPVHVLPELKRNRQTIGDAAVLTAALLTRRDLHDVVVVAHSKGGLIGKALMGLPAGDRITRMVAVNTPFAGSRWASYAVLRELRDFSPRGAVMRSSIGLVEVNERITSIYSSFDQVVPDGGRLEGAHNIRLPFLGHFRLLADGRTLSIIDRLTDAP